MDLGNQRLGFDAADERKGRLGRHSVWTQNRGSKDRGATANGTQHSEWLYVSAGGVLFQRGVSCRITEGRAHGCPAEAVRRRACPQSCRELVQENVLPFPILGHY